MEYIIKMIDYNSQWPEQFEQEKRLIFEKLGNTVIELFHIGSTAVPGLAAKPVIDMLLGVEKVPPSPDTIEALQTLEYNYLGEFGVPNRHFCRKGMPMTHHLHIVTWGTQQWENRILFRDFLRTHPKAAQQYEQLKRQSAMRFPHDRAAYTNSKTDLITELMEQAKRWQAVTLENSK
jgi:GrpB-like predicted nucleotidyltransferase (UPF0157 family)